jgi:molybdopterin converting factor small subunit
MAINIHVPPLLQPLTSSRETVTVTGTTVRECINDLKRQFPAVEEWLRESNPIAWVTVNRKIVGVEEMDQEVSESDELHIVLLLAGG